MLAPKFSVFALVVSIARIQSNFQERQTGGPQRGETEPAVFRPIFAARHQFLAIMQNAQWRREAPCVILATVISGGNPIQSDWFASNF